jgi:hypothetical protein
MATITYDSLTADVAPHVPGCPTATISATIRKVAIDLCERAKVWRVALTPLTLVSGTYNYTIANPVAQTEISAILHANLHLNTAAVDRPLELVTGEVVFSSYTGYPDLVALGEPRAIFQLDESTINVLPVPNTADTYVIRTFAAIRPAYTSTTIDSAVANQYRRELFHGALHELMMLPDRVWTDDQKSLYHGKQWTYLLNAAKARANKGFGRADINVVQRPWG